MATKDPTNWRNSAIAKKARNEARVVHVRRTDEKGSVRIVGTVALMELEDGRCVTGHTIAGLHGSASREIGRSAARGRAASNAAHLAGHNVRKGFHHGRIFDNLEMATKYITDLIEGNIDLVLERDLNK